MEIRIKRWGNSFGFRLPKPILNELEIKENDSFNVSVKKGEIVLKKNSYDEFSIREMAEKFYGINFAMCHHIDNSNEYNWGNAVGEEVW